MSYEFWIGARYAGLARAKRGASRGDRFVSFIAASSMAGIALGVAALIVVLSVMNGFQIQVRDRMLSVLPHIELFVPQKSADLPLDEWWPAIADLANQNSQVRGVAPFVAAQGMIVQGQALAGVQIRGIDPERESSVSDIAGQIQTGSLNDLKSGSFSIILGSAIAHTLGVRTGDTVVVLAPQGSISPAGFAPRMRQFKVAGVFFTDYYEYDASLAFMHYEDAAKVFRDSGNSGVRLRIADMQRAPLVANQLQQTLPSFVHTTNWTENNRTWFAAVQTEKRMMFLILALIVAVAAFNLLSSLVMAVKDKRSDIAILRTLGASPTEIAKIFLVQGSLIGVVGTLLGVGFGMLIAYNIDTIVPFIEGVLGMQFLPQQIYLISQLPSNPQASDIVIVAATSLVLSLLATLYPSWRASSLQPAQVLRHD